MDSHYDVVVVGAGLSGLPMARTYLHFEPDVKLLILDQNKTIGGVWAKEKLYPGLQSNNQFGTYEFPGFPMREELGVKKGQHIPGRVIHEYFREYAENYDLLKRIMFEKRVKSAEKILEGWRLRVASVVDGKEIEGVEVIICSKLYVATGLTSKPNPLDFVGAEDFEKPLIHFASLPRDAQRFLDDPSIKHVTVLGTGKAAFDSMYMFASAGKSVTWLMRKSGHGPTYMGPSHLYLGPFRFWLEKLVTTRFVTWFSPCVWGGVDGFGYVRSLLHGTKVGRWVVDTVWKRLEWEVVTQTGLNRHEEVKKLRPEIAAFWHGTNMALLNYPTDIHDLLVQGKANIIKKDIDRLEGGNRVKFTDGTSLETDAMISCMGWDYVPSIEFLPKDIQSDLGIPSKELSKSQQEMWDKVNAKADLEILERFPKLKEGPKPNRPPAEYTPWRLWRGVAPPHLKEKNLVFSGMLHNYNMSISSEISSVWAYAYMNGKLTDAPWSLSTQKDQVDVKASPEEPTPKADGMDDRILYDTALFNRFGVWRSPFGFTQQFPDFIFDEIAYFDLLLQDLGVNNWRKGWGVLGEAFRSYGPSDYAGLADEWLYHRKQE